jgi:hypothetical protein
MGEKRNAYSFLVGKPEGKRPLGRCRHRWVDNIRIHLTKITAWKESLKSQLSLRFLWNTKVHDHVHKSLS